MSKNFSKKERAIARYLSSFPRIKSFFKRVYQIVNYYRFNDNKNYNSDYKIESLNIGEAFFGYYDKSPLSLDGKFLLCHSVEHGTSKKPQVTYPIFINLIDFASKKIIYKHSVSSYNWQQGAKSQW